MEKYKKIMTSKYLLIIKMKVNILNIDNIFIIEN